MRKLTKEELKLAPEWASSYAVDEDGDVLFFDKDKDKIQSINGVNSFSFGDYRNIMRLALKSLDMEKPFDITNHGFSDTAKDCHVLFNNPIWAGGDLQIEIQDPSGCHADAILIKEHAIAIARHFNLTAEDLK